MSYVRIAEFRPSIGSENIGDHIIQQYINVILEELFPNKMTIVLPSRSWLSRENVDRIQHSDLAFVCGTNLLSSHMEKQPRQWCLSPITNGKLHAILLGVGWWQYQEDPDFYTKWILRNTLNTRYMHSVRDSYTEDKLKKAGITNVLNTACPTMWRLTEEHCEKIPRGKAVHVVTTLTNYNTSEEKDRQLLECLLALYDKVYVWLQAIEDFDYLKRLGYSDKVNVIPPSLKAYEQLLQSNFDIDYVGTRLHGGIHALNHGKRTLILAVDNRAKEIAKDTNLPAVTREIGADELENLIVTERETHIMLPTENISIWKQQFREIIGGGYFYIVLVACSFLLVLQRGARHDN